MTSTTIILQFAQTNQRVLKQLFGKISDKLLIWTSLELTFDISDPSFNINDIFASEKSNKKRYLTF